AGAQPGDRAAVAQAMREAMTAAGQPPVIRNVIDDAVGEARRQRAAGAVAVTKLAEVRRVRTLIDDGWRAYVRVQIDDAQRLLAAARDAAVPLVALPGGVELYADAALRLGAVLQYRRNPDAASLFALALALDPARPVTLAEFAPEVVDAVAAVRFSPAVLERVHVAAEPAGAMIAIDGKPLGRAPLDVEVTRGQHLVIARAPLFRAQVAAVRIDGAPGDVTVRLERDDAATALAFGAEPGLAAATEQSLVDTALTFAELDDVVVAALGDRRGGPALLAQRCTGAPARCTPIVEIGVPDRGDLAAAARAAWQAVQTGALDAPPSVLGATQPYRPDTRCRVCRSPYLWGGLGVAFIGTVVGLYLATQARPAPVITVNSHP
ncbi:MAG TPA: PEGA domain-containing protein, partial [Kofleriaceae bacterium]|nr:PEGA domain-containing protein [Kofleriaceae bacterium]